jgi:hypothetical protein
VVYALMAAVSGPTTAPTNADRGIGPERAAEPDLRRRAPLPGFLVTQLLRRRIRQGGFRRPTEPAAFAAGLHPPIRLDATNIPDALRDVSYVDLDGYEATVELVQTNSKSSASSTLPP